MAKAAEVHDNIVEELKSHVTDGDFITQCIFQPVRTLFSKNSIAVGGNILGIERHTYD